MGENPHRTLMRQQFLLQHIYKLISKTINETEGEGEGRREEGGGSREEGGGRREQGAGRRESVGGWYWSYTYSVKSPHN